MTAQHIEHLPEELSDWAVRHKISPDAMHELNRLLACPFPDEIPLDYEKNSETYNQNMCRIIASSRENTYLWRNNVGAYSAPGGRQIRYGLANESKKINITHKSSDLIGITPVTVTAEMVGMKLGVFTALEMKKHDWHPGEDAKREKAQLRFINAVRNAGGLGFFCRNPVQYKQLLDHWRIPLVTDRYKR